MMTVFDLLIKFLDTGEYAVYSMLHKTLRKRATPER